MPRDPDSQPGRGRNRTRCNWMMAEGLECSPARTGQPDGATGPVVPPLYRPAKPWVGAKGG